MREGGVVEHQAVLALQVAAGGIQGLVAQPFPGADAGHGAPALAFDEDLRFVVLFRSDFPAIEIVGPEEPFPVPAKAPDRRLHRCDRFLHGGNLRGRGADAGEQLRIVPALHDEQAGNHQRFGLAARGLVLSGLEGLVGIVGEAVQIEAVVPVGPADARQAVRAEVAGDVVETDLQMLQQGLFADPSP